MPAPSKAMQRFMGMVHATQKGDIKAPSVAVAKAANTMSYKSAKDFASTKVKGLPAHSIKIALQKRINKGRIKKII